MKNIKNDLNGFLVIDKTYNIGSTDVVNRLKHILHPYKIGHAGTLDPLATGVLPIALGYATKFIPFIMDGKKSYEFTVRWGQETASDDLGSEVVFTSEKRPTQEEIEKCIPKFIGDILQTPPTYSAIKINGQRAYDIARSGADVQLEPRKIHIDSLSISNHTKNETTFCVECGKGTYVRTIAHDLGRMLGCYGVVTHLRRCKCGPFALTDALDFEKLKESSFQQIQQNILPLEKITSLFQTITLPQNLSTRLLQGQRLNVETIQPYLSNPVQDKEILCLFCESTLLGLLQINHHTVQPYRIFPAHK